MILRVLRAILAASLLAGCGGNHARSISERALAHGEGQATTSQIFGAAARTCIGIGDREEALATSDSEAQRALSLRGRDQYSVVVVQFDEAGHVFLRRRFHLRNAFAYIDIDDSSIIKYLVYLQYNIIDIPSLYRYLRTCINISQADI